MMALLTEKLIEIVKEFPILYDASHEYYKNIRRKDRIWKNLGNELNESGEELKKKWKNLRDTYSKHLKCVKTKGDQYVKKDYKRWQWAQHMEPFKPFIIFPRTDTNVNEVESEQEYVILEQKEGTSEQKSTQFYELEGHFLANESNSDLEKINNVERTIPSRSERNRTKSTLRPTTEIIRKYSKRKRRNSDTSGSSADKTIGTLEKGNHVTGAISTLATKQMEAIDLIFLGYANTVKSFSPKRQAMAKYKFAELLFHLELEQEEEVSVTATNQKSSTSSSILNCKTSVSTSESAKPQQLENDIKPPAASTSYNRMGN